MKNPGVNIDSGNKLVKKIKKLNIKDKIFYHPSAVLVHYIRFLLL